MRLLVKYCKIMWKKGAGDVMAKFRETPCMYYICLGECKKGKRDATHKGRCQTCDKYVPRAKVRRVNQKRLKLDKILRNENYL